MANAEAKALLQEQVLEAFKQTTFSNHPYRMALFTGTGSGKTKAAIDCAKWFMDTIRNGPVLFGCHSTVSRDIDTPKQLMEWAQGHSLFNKSVRFCYDSFHHIKDSHFAVGIFDEFHYITAKSFGVFKRNKFDAIILLTATEPRSPAKKRMIRELTGSNRFELSVDEGVNRGITNDYRINIFYLEMDDKIQYCQSPNPKDRDLYTEEGCYYRYCKWIGDAKSFKESGRILPMRYAALQRWMANTRTKMAFTRYSMEIMRKRNRRMVVFAQSKEQCHRLSAHVMHSGTTDAEYQRFLRKEINELVCIDQIREGANIDDLERALIMGVNSDPLPMIQRNGRLLRLDATQQSELIIPIFHGTFDDIWVTKALKKFARHKIIKHNISMKTIDKYWYD